MTRKEVYALIDGERHYQEGQQESGRFEKPTKTTAEEVLIIQVYAQRAAVAWTDNRGDEKALEIVRKIAALAVRCMENHDTPKR